MHLYLDQNARATIRKTPEPDYVQKDEPKTPSSPSVRPFPRINTESPALKNLFRDDMCDEVETHRLPPVSSSLPPNISGQNDDIDLKIPITVPDWPAPILPTPQGQQIYYHRPSLPYEGPIPTCVDGHVTLRHLYVAIKAEIQWQLTLIPKNLCLNRGRIPVQTMAEYQRLAYEYWTRRIDALIYRYARKARKSRVTDAVAALYGSDDDGEDGVPEAEQSEEDDDLDENGALREYNMFDLTSSSASFYSKANPTSHTRPSSKSEEDQSAALSRSKIPRLRINTGQRKDKPSLSPCLFLASRLTPTIQERRFLCRTSSISAVDRSSIDGLPRNDARVRWERRFRVLIDTVHKRYLHNEENFNRIMAIPDERKRSCEQHLSVGVLVLNMLKKWSKEWEQQRVRLELAWKRGNIDVWSRGAGAVKDTTKVNGVCDVSGGGRKRNWDEYEDGHDDKKRDDRERKENSRMVQRNMKTIPLCQFVDPVQVMGFTPSVD